MLKVVTLLKKREGMSTAAFRRYYEDHHRLIGEKYLAGFASRYLRRYLDTLPGRESDREAAGFDVLLEIWFEDEARYLACGERLSEPAVAAEIARDEEALFDRSCKRSFVLHECESVLP